VKLRCKDGDVAIITWDYHDCLENLGRLVEVRGPVDLDDGHPKWDIQPITPELYALRERDDSVIRETVTWMSRVQHPDAWMIPIQPNQETLCTDEAVNLEWPTPAAASADDVVDFEEVDAAMTGLTVR
jgi:hypothetical protein